MPIKTKIQKQSIKFLKCEIINRMNKYGTEKINVVDVEISIHIINVQLKDRCVATVEKFYYMCKEDS